MPSEEEIKKFRAAIETSSQQYGNNKTIADVFESPIQPQPWELIDALSETVHLTEKESYAFVYENINRYPILAGDADAVPDPFENEAELNSAKLTAKQKIADAIWIYELIDAYRHPDFPEECRECGAALGGTWVGRPSEGKPGVLCTDCADGDSDQRI